MTTMISLLSIDPEAAHAAEVRARFARLLTGSTGTMSGVLGFGPDAADRYRDWVERAGYVLCVSSDRGWTVQLPKGESEDLLRGTLMIAAVLDPNTPAEYQLLNIIDNSRLDVDAVRSLLRQALDGMELGSLQRAWRALAAGAPQAQVAAETGISPATVERLSRFWDVRGFRRNQLIDWGMAALGDGWGYRQLAEASGMSLARSREAITAARKVQAELDGVAA